MQIFKKSRQIVMSYVVITLGLMLYTFGWSAFMLPMKIVGGGVSGMSAILYYAVGIHVPIGVLNFIFNAILVAIGFKMLGSKFGANTIYGIIMSSLCFILWQQVLQVDTWFDVEHFGVFMCAVLGGVCCGAGIGLSFIMGGNSGGTDIIALIVCKYHNISPGRVIMLIDVVIIGCSFFVSHKLDNVICGYVVMVVMTYVLDMVLDGNKQSYQVMVFSSKNDEIGDAVTKEVGRGALGELTHLGSLLRQVVERCGQVFLDLLEDLGLGGALELERHRGGGLEFDGHATELGQQVEVVETADEISDTAVDRSVGAGVGAVLDAGDHGVCRVDSGVHVVPPGTCVDGIGVDGAAYRRELGVVVVPHTVGVVGTDGVLVGTVVEQAVACLGAVVVAEVRIQADDELVKTFGGGEVVGAAHGGMLLLEEILAAGDRDDHGSCQQTGKDIFVHFHIPNTLSG